jgi:peptidoglycan/LPS O-acetylase OafA/YrhL
MKKIYMIGFNANQKQVHKSEQVVPNSLDFLNGIRAIAALFVLISHFWYQIWPAVTPPLGYAHRPTGLTLILTSWLYYGHFAVVVFIVLSEFCLLTFVMCFIAGSLAVLRLREADPADIF